MVQRIAPRLVACWAVCVCTAVVYQLWPFLPFARGQAHVLTGSFLGLMIAFRANTGWVCVYTSLFESYLVSCTQTHLVLARGRLFAPITVARE